MLDHRVSDMPALSRAMAAAGGAKGTLDRGVASSDKKSTSKARKRALALTFDGRKRIKILL